MSTAMISFDMAKSGFQVHTVNAATQVVIRCKLFRSKLLVCFEKQDLCNGST